MEGVLDSLVRELLTEVNDYDLCITEFLRVVDQLLPVKSFYRLCPELHHQSRTPTGTRVRVQLLGQYPEWLAENAARAVALGSWGVDLNCGCPSKLVNGSGGGATLLKDPELIYRGAKAMREAVPADLPVTVKVRLGWDSGERRFEIADAVQQAGASELVVHGRTKEDGYKAERINWQAIGEIRQRLTIPVVANGDIDSPHKAKAVLAETGADAIMIGRAAPGRPWLFREIAHFMATGERLAPPLVLEVRRALLDHLHDHYSLYGDYTGVRSARKHIGWYVRSLPGGEALRERINALEAAELQWQAVADYFEEMAARHERLPLGEPASQPAAELEAR